MIDIIKGIASVLGWVATIIIFAFGVIFTLATAATAINLWFFSDDTPEQIELICEGELSSANGLYAEKDVEFSREAGCSSEITNIKVRLSETETLFLPIDKCAYKRLAL